MREVTTSMINQSVSKQPYHCSVLLVSQGSASVKGIVVLLAVNVAARVRGSFAHQSVMEVEVPRERRSVHCILLCLWIFVCLVMRRPKGIGVVAPTIGTIGNVTEC
jgi:hypothetical protein